MSEKKQTLSKAELKQLQTQNQIVVNLNTNIAYASLRREQAVRKANEDFELQYQEYLKQHGVQKGILDNQLTVMDLIYGKSNYNIENGEVTLITE